jgi:class 3 adenylate cyclase/CheY-like chemotaxis protein
MKLNALIIQTDDQSARLLLGVLKSHGFEAAKTDEFQQAKSLLEAALIPLVFLDLHFPGEDWQSFIRWIRQNHPQTRLIITSKFPDLQREMKVREMGIEVFLRQPFIWEWVDLAIQKTGWTNPEADRRVKGAGKPGSPLPKVRFPVQLKITLPYLILAAVLALACAYIISQIVFDSVQERYFNQLIASSKQGSDWMVGEENRLLSTLRLVSNQAEIGDALLKNDLGKMEDSILPVMETSGSSALEVLDRNGLSVLSIRKSGTANRARYEIAEERLQFQDQEFVQKILNGSADSLGDKFVGVLETPGGQYLFVSAPLHSSGGELAGAVLVGSALAEIVQELQGTLLVNVSLYDRQGKTIISTYANLEKAPAVAEEQALQLFSGQDQASISRSVRIDSVEYTELLGVWEARSGQTDLGIIGISLPQAFLVQTSQVTRLQVFVISLAVILFIVLIGVFLSNRITKPLLKLVDVSTEVANGNLDVKVDSRGNDEVAVLAHAFNSMVAGLQEGSIYRDLLGRTVSPEVREELRHTFSSGDLRLEGQDALATVLFADICDFTSIAEKANPSTIFEWLNEYFKVLLPCIIEENGVVNKLDGDAVLAFFGILPKILNPQTSAFYACQAALRISQEICVLNQKRIERGDLPFITGIGVHTGEVIAGGLGTRDRIHYTIIGDTVNTAQRIEGLTRELFQENGILISQATLNALGDLKDRFVLEAVGRYSLKGREDKVMVYHLLGLAS